MRCDFDGGTIVLRDLPPGVAQELPALAWDARVSAHRAASSDWAAIHDALADRRLMPPRRMPVAGTLPPPGGPSLRGYQRAALGTWEACGRRGVIELPTGAGKTRVALEAIARLGGRALVLVPTRVLLGQWVEQLRAIGGDEPGRFGDGRRELRAVTVATYASAWRHAARLGARFDLLVADEAHHVGGTLSSEVLETSSAPHRLGLTAMAPPADRQSELARLVGPVVFRLRVRDLGSVLAPVKLVGIGVDMTPEERAHWTEDMGAFRAELARHALDLRGAAFRDVVARLGRSPEGERALVAWRRANERLALTRAKRIVLAEILVAHGQDRVLVFARDKASAHALSRRHLVPAITCDMRAPERRDVLSAFARGEIRTLVAARVLDEGLDVPEASVAVILGAAGGPRQHVQRVGRVLRPAPGKRALVYDVFHPEAEASRAAAGRRALDR